MLLKARGVEIDRQDWDDCTPVHRAAIYGQSDSRGTRETKDRLALVEAELDQHEAQMKKRENSWTARIQELCLQFKAERLRADAIQVLHQ